MKKKLLTTAFVCSLSAACIFCATACNNGGDNGGGAPDVGPSVQVDEEGWMAAVNNTRQSTNFTWYCKSMRNDETTEEMTRYVWDNEQYAISDYYVISEYEEGSRTNRTHYYHVNGGEPYYFPNYTCSNDGSGWQMDEFNLYDKLGISLAEIYYKFSEFTYNDGKYTATLSIKELLFTDVQVTIKINGGGYISYVSNEMILRENKYKVEYTYYNYGKTTYNVPEEAKKVIEDYKNAKN